MKPLIPANSIDRTLSIAPMMGCTDRHCRALMRFISPHSLLFTEMIVADALIHGDTNHFLQHGKDEPCVMQIGGSDPQKLKQCAKWVEEAGYQEINLNVGCPSDRVQHGGIGACLMAEPELVAECVSEMQSNTAIPVTVKCRIGINDMDSYEHFKYFVTTLVNAGCKIFYVHARKAILGGLSPKENREIPPLKYDYIYKIAAEFPQIQFYLNGGIKNIQDALTLLPKVDGVMIGRAPYSNPYLLADLEKAIYDHTSPTRLEIVHQYIEYASNVANQKHHPKHILKHLLGLFTGCVGARSFRRHLSEHMFEPNCSIDVVYDAIKIAESKGDFHRVA